MKKVVFALLVATICIQANAQRAAQVAGQGWTPCGVYLEDRKTGDRVQSNYIAVWVRGYLSGYNTFATQPKLDTIPEIETVWTYLDRYCRDNPLDRIANGVDSLIASLGGYAAPYLINRK